MANAVLTRRTRIKPDGKAPAPRTSVRALWIPLAAAVLLAALPLFFSRIGENPHLAEILWSVSAALLVFLVFVLYRAKTTGRCLTYKFVPIKSHYVQLVMHTCVYTYWGWYWREVYDHIPLFLAQIVFAYCFDSLLCWSRRKEWILGFGPIPIILSTNLFLWFRDDWYYLQFLMIACGVLGKEFIKWRRDGRLTHIFNPSALSLFLFSVVLIATKSTGMTWGIEISDSLHYPPHIYLEIFLLGLVVQGLFQVTLVTLFSAVALYLLNTCYTKVTGDYNFIDSNIPVSVFLGLHLLVTDPATSPRRSIGKIIFGLMYGAGVFGMYRFLTLIGAPEFYDKLLCVPALNLCVTMLDRSSIQVENAAQRLGRLLFRTRLHLPGVLLGPRANLAWMSVWIAFFGFMFASGFLNKGSDHPGGNPAYWSQRCQSGRQGDCVIWARVLNATCEGNDAKACLQVADVLNAGKLIPRDGARSGVVLARACDSGSQLACQRLLNFMRTDGKDLMNGACDRGDGASCFVLGSLYSGGSGLPQDATLAFQLFQKSCDDRWWRGCGRLGISYLVGQGTDPNPDLAITNLEKGCRGQNAPSCFELARAYWNGTDGLPRKDLAMERLQKACHLGLQAACDQAAKLSPHP